ncbi:MAG: citrate lyase subunit alpha [Bacteroidales bacterium]|nr:citrate lyase subunit alpha [Bacteroidales bacterium]
MVKNAAGRMVPDEINGTKAVPFRGVGKHRPGGRKYAPPIPTCIDYPEDNNKVIASLREALELCGLKDGMTISTHHHLRDGDLVSNQIFRIASEKGIKDLVWAPFSLLPLQ